MEGVKRKRRIHGLQRPLHPQQVIGWVVVLVIIALMYGAVVPALHSSFVPPVAAASATLFLAHLVAHATALALDPAHPDVRASHGKRFLPEFDKSLHSHVIENGRCHLCNITINSGRTKHCGSCNKCVDVFDHHCKWLNNCIGRRNYRLFLATVITAILSCLMVMATCLTEIILYYFNRQYLAPWENGIPTISPQDENYEEESHISCVEGSPYCHFSVFGARVYDGAFIGLLSTLFSLALIAGVLLIHLMAFHVYLLLLGLTTYEYIRGTSMAASNSANSFGGRTDPARDGATCGWNIGSRPLNNQITPSSTTDTALLASPDLPSTTTTSPGTLSPRSNPSTPADDSRNLLGGRHLMVHHKQGQPLSTRGLSSPRNSSVPTLPKIPGAERAPLRTVSRSVASDSSLKNDDNDLTVHLVAIPRPPRTTRRRLRSSVAPHLSPIKECDIASSSPPSLRMKNRGSGEFDSPSHFSSCATGSLPNAIRSSPPPSVLKLNRTSPKPHRPRPSPSRGKTRFGQNGDTINKVSGREKYSNYNKSSPSVPSPYRKSSPRGVLSKTNSHSPSNNVNSKYDKSPGRPVSAPAQIHIIRKSSSFNGTNRIGTPTLRFKLPNKETNGHIITNSAEATVVPGNCDSANGNVLSIVRSSSDGLLIKMGDVTRGGVYIGPHKSDSLLNSLNSRGLKNAKGFVEHHM